MDIASFSADLKIVGGVSTSSGFTPTFSSVFNATAGVEASLGLALPIEFGVGLAIPGEYLPRRFPYNHRSDGMTLQQSTLTRRSV